MTNQDRPTCATCRWWEASESSVPGVFGECRRNAPVRCGSKEGNGTYPGWPPTTRDDWCGEHAPVEPASDKTLIVIESPDDFVAVAADHGMRVVGIPEPGDAVTVGGVTWQYEPNPKRLPDVS